MDSALESCGNRNDARLAEVHAVSQHPRASLVEAAAQATVALPVGFIVSFNDRIKAVIFSFISDYASGSGHFCASAPCYRGAENVCVVTVVVSPFELGKHTTEGICG
jgi:hypothetical protein